MEIFHVDHICKRRLFKVKMAKRRMTGEDVLNEIFNDKDSDEDDLELDLGVDELEVIDGDECNSEQSDVDAEIDDELDYTAG